MSEFRLPSLLSGGKKSRTESPNRMRCVLGKHIAGQNPIIVYQCTLPNHNQPLVAKVVIVGQDDAKDSLQEANLLARLSHPYLVKYVHSYLDSKKLYIIMEYCEGGDLRKVINYQRGRSENLFGVDIVLGWFVQLCLALQYIHKQKILHRDVTPSNVFLSADGTVKLGDFGLAKVLQYQSQMRTSNSENSLLYQAPEITVGGQPASTKCDMFAVGCVLYELCTGYQPFESSSLNQSRKNACRGAYKSLSSSHSDELRSLVDRLLSSRPHERPSAEEVLKEPFLKRFLNHFSPRDTGSSMSMRDEVTSSGYTVTDVLRSIRQEMSGAEDNFLSESEIRVPPNTPTTPVERSFPDVSRILSTRLAEKSNLSPCQWYNTGRRSSKVSPEKDQEFTDNLDARRPSFLLSGSPLCPSPKINNYSNIASGKNSSQKLKTVANSVTGNLLKVLESYKNVARERFASN